MRVVRRVAIVSLIAAASLTAAAPTGLGDVSAPRVSAGPGASVRLPEGWRLIDKGADHPAAVASFAAAFARLPCPCARPNFRTCGAWCEEPSIRNFARTGALVFVWEYP